MLSTEKNFLEENSYQPNYNVVHNVCDWFPVHFCLADNVLYYQQLSNTCYQVSLYALTIILIFSQKRPVPLNSLFFLYVGEMKIK